MYKKGQEIDFTITGRSSMRRVTGTIHEVKDNSVLCRLNKGKGKREYEVPHDEIITEGNDPLRDFVSALRG